MNRAGFVGGSALGVRRRSLWPQTFRKNRRLGDLAQPLLVVTTEDLFLEGWQRCRCAIRIVLGER